MKRETDTPPAAGAERGATPHLLRIDVLRAVAILSVFLLHWFGQAYGTDHLNWNGLLRDPASAPSTSFIAFFPLSFGWMGVPLFFVISGFCIHASALKNNELRVGRFFWRRFWRIYPPYLAALIFAIFISQTDITTADGQGQLWSHLLLIHNFRADWIFALNGVFWSLAVEAQLYLLYPLLWQLRVRWGIAGALKLTLLLSVVGRVLCAVFLTRWDQELSGPMWTSPLFLWFDWTLGAFLAERYLAGAVAFPKGAFLRWIAFVVLVISTFAKPTAIFTFSLASVFFALAAESYLRREKAVGVVERWLVPLGLCSYSFYLIHYPLVRIIAEALRSTGNFDNPALLICSAPVGIITIGLISFVAYLIVERGSIALGRRLFASRGGAAL
ncbi:MAG TPA: acyltransferase [Chthoniobacterales bacterium]|nr:acyltransferase [Chthoniobacterales bacterium]